MYEKFFKMIIILLNIFLENNFNNNMHKLIILLNIANLEKIKLKLGPSEEFIHTYIGSGVDRKHFDIRRFFQNI